MPVLVILGMHRSGTSLTAQWIHACGLHLGDRLLGADNTNTKGHYEDLDFLELHEAIFRTNGVPWDGLQRVPPLRLGPEQQEKLRSLIALKNSQYPAWGWKEPRTCLYLDRYVPLLGNTATYLIVFRSANAVVDSLLRRKKQQLKEMYWQRGRLAKYGYTIARRSLERELETAHMENYTDAWIQYNESILKAIASLETSQYRVISQASFPRHSQEIFDWITERGFQLQHVPFENVLDPKLMNAASPNLKFAGGDRQQIADIEAHLHALARTGD